MHRASCSKMMFKKSSGNTLALHAFEEMVKKLAKVPSDAVVSEGDGTTAPSRVQQCSVWISQIFGLDTERLCRELLYFMYDMKLENWSIKLEKHYSERYLRLMRKIRGLITLFNWKIGYLVDNNVNVRVHNKNTK